jgi:hypothetical protein
MKLTQKIETNVFLLELVVMVNIGIDHQVFISGTFILLLLLFIHYGTHLLGIQIIDGILI